jgi:predicted metalloprotease
VRLYGRGGGGVKRRVEEGGRRGGGGGINMAGVSCGGIVVVVVGRVMIATESLSLSTVLFGQWLLPQTFFACLRSFLQALDKTLSCFLVWLI